MSLVIRSAIPKANPAGPLALLLLLPTLLAAVSAAPYARAQEISHTPDNPYGTNVFLHKEVETWKIEKTLQMVAEANIPWVKQQFPWQEIEFKKGYFHDDKWDKSAWEKFDRIVDLAEKYDLNLVARVDKAPQWATATDGSGPLKSYDDLADFINALLDQYEGRLKYVQVWNEPNLAGEWVPGKPVDPAGYAEMMQTVYPAVKERHPDAVILSAPLAMTLDRLEMRGNMNELDYWEGLYEAGIKGNFDIATANGYGLDQPPDAPPDPKVLNFRRVELLRQIMVRNGDADTPIWFNEYGWNASPATLAEEERLFWRNVTPRQQAEWTVQGIEYARENWPWAGTVFIWYFRQVGDIPPDKAEYYFAMLDPEFKPQPVYQAVKQAALKYPGPSAATQPLATPTATPTATPAAVPAAEETPTSAPATSTAAPATEIEPTPEITATPTGAAPTASPSPVSASPTPAPARPTATPEAGAFAGDSGPNVLLYAFGAMLLMGGLGALVYYFMQRRSISVSGGGPQED